MAITALLPGTIWAPEMPVTVGVLDDNARFAYTNGQCHAFAIALRAVIGGDLVWAGNDRCQADDGEDCPHDGDVLPDALTAMLDADCPCQIDHLLVKTGDEYLDIDGAWDETALLNRGFVTVGYLMADEAAALAGLPTWRTPDLEVAAALIEPYLAWLNRPDLEYPAD